MDIQKYIQVSNVEILINPVSIMQGKFYLFATIKNFNTLRYVNKLTEINFFFFFKIVQ